MTSTVCLWEIRSDCELSGPTAVWSNSLISHAGKLGTERSAPCLRLAVCLAEPTCNPSRAERPRPWFLFSQTRTTKHFLTCHSCLLLYPSRHFNSESPPAQWTCAILRVACQYHPGMGGPRARPSLVASLSPGELLKNKILGSGDCRVGLGTTGVSFNSSLPISISFVPSKPAVF